jgi:hypothetical protein
MLLFSAKTRQLINVAVDALPDPTQRQVWRTWAQEHPSIRRPEGPTDDDGPPLPRDVCLVAVSALEALENNKRHRQNSTDMTEDELSDLDHDLSYIRAVTQLLRQTSSADHP